MAPEVGNVLSLLNLDTITEYVKSPILDYCKFKQQVVILVFLSGIDQNVRASASLFQQGIWRKTSLFFYLEFKSIQARR